MHVVGADAELDFAVGYMRQMIRKLAANEVYKFVPVSAGKRCEYPASFDTAAEPVEVRRRICLNERIFSGDWLDVRSTKQRLEFSESERGLAAGTFEYRSRRAEARAR